MSIKLRFKSKKCLRAIFDISHRLANLSKVICQCSRQFVHALFGNYEEAQERSQTLDLGICSSDALIIRTLH